MSQGSKRAARAMKREEAIAEAHLKSRGFADIVYEPVKNSSPDFLLDGRIAVEVRRLNQHADTPSGPQPLETARYTVANVARRIIARLPPPVDDEAWFIGISFRRPLPNDLESTLRAALISFRDAPDRERTSKEIAPDLSVTFARAGQAHPTFFRLGMLTDSDTGGFVSAQLVKNLPICIEDKTRKHSKVTASYGEWWLLLVDYVGVDATDYAHVRTLLKDQRPWNKILIVSPDDPFRGFDL